MVTSTKNLATATGTTTVTGAPTRKRHQPPVELGRRRWWILAALCLSMLVVGLDGTVLNVALTDIATSLHASTGQLQWIVNGYLLTLAVLLIPAGVLGDRLGRGRVLAAGLGLFVLASAAAAWAGSPEQLIATRAVMGAGAAAVMPLALSIIPTIFSPAERPKAVAVATAAMGLGMPLGPLVAGWLLDHFWWGSTMLINVPVVAVALVAGLVLIPHSRDPHPRRLDLPGLVLTAFGFAALVYGVIQAPVYGWGAPSVLVALVAAAVLLGALVVVERRSVTPLVDRDLLADRSFVWPTVSIALSSFALLGLLFVVPQFLQAVQGRDALGTGVRLMPVMVALVLGSGLAGRMTRRLGATVLICAGLLVTAAGFVLLLPVQADSGYPTLLLGLSVIGFGFGLSVPPAMDAMLGALTPALESTGTALNNAAKQLAGALGVALLGNLVNTAYTSGVHSTTDSLPAATGTAAHESVQAGMAVADKLGGAAGAHLRSVAANAYVTGMHHTAITCAAVCVLTAAVLAVALRRRA